jgi:hypothetical protein
VQIGDYPVVLVRDRDGDPRLPQFLPPSRQPRLQHSAAPRPGWSAPIISGPTSSTAACCSPARWPTASTRVAVRPEAGRLRERRRLHLHLPGQGTGGFRADAGDDRALSRAAPAGRAKIAFESTIVEKGNWKLVWENNRECYHCAANHPELCKTFPEAPTVTGVDGADSDPRWSRIGPGARRRPAEQIPHGSETGQYRATRAPLLRDAVSYTMTGKRAVKRRLSDTSPPTASARCCCTTIRRPGTTSWATTR